MDPRLYLAYRLRKQAGAQLGFGMLVNALVDAAKSTGQFVAENFMNSAKVALPATSLVGAYLLYKANSPKAVADVAHEYAANSNEAESVMQSMRDLEELKVRKKLEQGKRKVHDRFL